MGIIRGISLFIVVIGGLITFLVRGCSSSPSAVVVTPASVRAQVYLIGDGLLGGSDEVTLAQSTPVILTELLKDAKSNLTVVDKTKPNDSALGVLDKSDWYLSDAHAGDIAILVIGFEDAKNAQDLTQVTANLTEIIEKLQSKNMSVILIQLTDGLGILPVEMRSPFAQMYLDVSTQTQVPLVSGIFEDLWLDDTNVAPDEFHLSAQGNKLLAQKLYDLLQK